ncbi:hypothetical protein B0T16DRAFT_76475 [Cercophora newfieldiana]|uniref:BHLH domain-containing protein n=1 Tax=Cercophora newfieldiana TaxID=92897 RepID=A0AA39YGZ2_9PEZI|nr:hypothetical protein B0T16DRAFT_76475 [Cercophora newfieldiana]
MGSQHESDGTMPFGYQGFRFDQHLLGAQPLLGEDETQRIDDFFEEFMGGNQTDALPQWHGEGLALQYSDNWISTTELIAHGTSFGAAGGDDHLAQNMEQPYYQYVTPAAMMPVPGPALHNGGNLGASAEVLAAASALSGANGAHLNMPFGISPITSTSMPSTSTATPAPSGHMPIFPFGGYGLVERNTVPRNDALLNEMIFGREESARPVARQPPPAEIIQYGTDPNFNRPRFHPATWQDSLPAIASQQDGMLNCLERTISAAPTRASSPVPTQMHPPGLRTIPEVSTTKSEMIQAKHTAVLPVSAPDDDEAAPPRKRVKSKPDLMDEAQTLPVRAKFKGGRSNKPSPAKKSAAANEEPAAGVTKKRRRSNNQGSSPPKQRENLTEEQKRSNHIRSEQKRRCMISQGFKDLEAVVPELGNAGLSKSVTLQKTAKFIEELLSGNTQLKEQLEALKAAGDASNGVAGNG